MDDLRGFMSNLLSVGKEISSSCQESTLDDLVSCMSNSPGQCGSFTAKIEQYALPLLSSNSEVIRENAGLCMALTVHCSGGGKGRNCDKSALGSTQPAEAWHLQVDKGLASLESILSQLFVEIELEGPKNKQSSRLSLFSVVDCPEPSRMCTLLRQFNGVTFMLCALLELQFSSTVQLPAEDILNVICRALSILPKHLSTRSTPEFLRLLAILPLLQCDMLRMLESLVTAGRGGLIPYADTVGRLIVQTLEGYQSREGTGEGSYGVMRCAVYSAAGLWVRELGAASGLDAQGVCAKLIAQIVCDVQPQRDVLTLVTRSHSKLDAAEHVLTNSRKTGTKRKRQAGGGPYTTQQHSSDVIDSTAHSTVCLSALRLLRALLLGCGAAMPRTQRRAVHDFCAPLIADIQRQRGTLEAPYSNGRCRHALYEVLKSLVLCAPAHETSLSLLMRLLSAGLRDLDPDIKLCCHEGLAVCTNLVHPRFVIIGRTGRESDTR